MKEFEYQVSDNCIIRFNFYEKNDDDSESHIVINCNGVETNFSYLWFPYKKTDYESIVNFIENKKKINHLT